MAVTKQDVQIWLDALQTLFLEKRQELTDLDSAVGDGDFGISLERGFTAVHTELTAKPPADLKSVFQNTATVLIKSMGGSSGPLLGTFFSGERQAVLAGTYDLLVETEPSRIERGVRVQPGGARVLNLTMPPASETQGP